MHRLHDNRNALPLDLSTENAGRWICSLEKLLAAPSSAVRSPRPLMDVMDVTRRRSSIAKPRLRKILNLRALARQRAPRRMQMAKSSSFRASSAGASHITPHLSSPAHGRLPRLPQRHLVSASSSPPPRLSSASSRLSSSSPPELSVIPSQLSRLPQHHLPRSDLSASGRLPHLPSSPASPPSPCLPLPASSPSPLLSLSLLKSSPCLPFLLCTNLEAAPAFLPFPPASASASASATASVSVSVSVSGSASFVDATPPPTPTAKLADNFIDLNLPTPIAHLVAYQR